MAMESDYKSAVGVLRGILSRVEKDGELASIISSKDEVIARYRPVFSLDNIGQLTEEEFKGFLLFKNNMHWSGLHRLGGILCEDMARLRRGLQILVDESRPISQRLEELVPKSGQPYVKRLGKAVLTAILQVAYPDKYGVYNGISEAGMAQLGLWPEFDRGASFSERYLTINKILTGLAQELGIDLWTLDSLWWRVNRPVAPPDKGELPQDPDDETDPYRFGLERHLHNFMVDNWRRIPLSKEWDLYEADGDVVGSEYDTKEIGRIDLLARHKSKPGWLVIELKRNQTCDDTVGQVLRYMGWVRANLAAPKETIEGLIVAHETDPRLRYALQMAADVRLMLYTVDFHLEFDKD